MTSPPVSVLLIAPPGSAPPATAGAALEVVRLDAPVSAGAFAEAARRCAGDLVWPLTQDAEVPDGAWAALADVAAANPDADAFHVAVDGLAPDPAWHGRRCRAHERNWESLRFARLLPLGALAVRRERLVAAAEGLGEDWWRELGERLARATRIAPTGVAIARRARLDGEPAAPSFAPPEVLGRRRVLVLGQIEVSTSLYFDVLESLPEMSVAFRPLTGLAVDAPHLAAADVVILVRELHRFWDEGVIAFLDAAKVPYLYFTDDNFLALRAEGGASSFYSRGRMRRALRRAEAMWVSTAPLREASAGLHPSVALWRPTLDPALREPPPPPADKLTIAIAGGDFRVGGLAGPVLDQLRAIATTQPLRIVATEAVAKALGPELAGVEIIAMPMERSFRQFVRQWRRHAVDILLHPAGATVNAPYKCPTALIVAEYLGATPVVADEPAYGGWGVSSGAITLRDSASGLAIAARRARDPVWRGELGRRLTTALDGFFTLTGREAALERLAATQRGPGPAASEVLASPGFWARRLGLLLARTLRRLVTLSR